MLQAPVLMRVAQRVQMFSVMRNRNFRLYWSGLLVSVNGYQMLQVAQGWLIYDLTGEAKFLGILGLVMAVPTLTLNLAGGVIADRVDKRKLIMGTQSAAAVLIGLLATLVFLNLIQIWHVLIIAFLSAGAQAIDSPSRMSLYPHLIDRKHLMNAVALSNSVWQATRIIGPSLAGFLIATSGMASPFYFAALSFLGMVLAMWALRAPPIPRSQGTSVFQDLAEGARFVWSDSLFAFLIGMTFFNSFFGMSYMLLLPVFAKDILHVGAEGLGLLHGVSGAGALLMTVIAASLRDSPHRGFLLIGGAALFGTLLLLFALSRSYPLSLLLLFLAGGSTSLYMIMVQTTLQARVPDHLRGRVMGIYGVTWSLLPLGALQAGFVADLMGAPFAVGLGGIAVASFAVGVAILNPRVRGMGLQSVQQGAVS